MKCPACIVPELVKTKTKQHGFHMEYCPDCKGIWFERIELERILLKLNEIEIPASEAQKVERAKEEKEETAKENSPILDSIYANKELHHLHNLKGKPHWIHRLFS